MQGTPSAFNHHFQQHFIYFSQTFSLPTIKHPVLTTKSTHTLTSQHHLQITNYHTTRAHIWPIQPPKYPNQRN